MKKIISILLCAVMLAGTAVLTANAATAHNRSVSASQYSFQEISTTTLPNNAIRSYTYGITEVNNPCTTARFTNSSNNQSYSLDLTECIKSCQSISLPRGIYNLNVCNGKDIYNNYDFDKTGGTYVLTRFKISDFSSYFNSDGTHTRNYTDGYTHNYNFTKENDGNISQLAIISGAYVNFVAPDKDGYVQAYIRKRIGDKVTYFTNFRNTPGGGVIASINLLIIGNSSASGKIDIDDVTAIQKYTAGIETFNSLQERNADANGDGKIDVDDATMIQKFNAGYNV